MKLKLLYCLFPLISWQTCINKTVSSTKEIKPEELRIDRVSFVNQVQPILVKKCSPCHFTGGKMFEKMPFDQDTTILNHEAGILKRFKDEENLIISTFIKQSKSLRK